MLTGDQLRMARAALRLTVKDTAELAGIDKGTIVRIEAGENAYRLTLLRLKEVLEIRGLEFLDAQEGIGGTGVRFKWGVELPERQQGDSTGSIGGPDSLKALSWEDDLEEAMNEPTPDQLELREYWRSQPEQWAAFHESSRQVILGMMGLRRL